MKKFLKYLTVNMIPPLSLFTRYVETDEKIKMDSPTGLLLRLGILGGLGYFIYKKLK